MISIIVPIYNSELYLSRCIDSILKQTYSDFELLLINDGSKDRSAEICDHYAKRDNRIKVFNKANGGVSSARNLGLKNISGEYVTFIDSDDWIVEEYLEKLINNNEDADLICQTAVLLNEDGYEIDRPNYNNNKCLYKNITKKDIEDLLLSGWLNWSACKLYKSFIIINNNISFDESISFSEDTLFTVQYIIHAKKVLVENIANYRYIIYQTKNSLSGNYSYENIKHLKYANSLICSIVYNDDRMARKLFLKRMMIPYYTMLKQYFKSHNAGNNIHFLYSMNEDKDFIDCCELEHNPFLLSKITKFGLEKKSKLIIFVIYMLYKIKRHIKH